MLEPRFMARKDSSDTGIEGAIARAGQKIDKKLKKHYEKLEAAIDKQFAILTKTQGYARDELEEIRWDYRYSMAPKYKLTAEDVEYMAGARDGQGPPAGGSPKKVKRGKAKGKDGAPQMFVPPGFVPPPGGAAGGPSGTGRPPGEYTRKSDVDLALIEKYLDRKVYHGTRNEMAAVYKEAFGEDLVVPERVDLVDLAMPAKDLSAGHRAGKLSKAEILGLPEPAGAPEGTAAEKPPQAEPAVEAAPAVKRESRTSGLLMAWRRGVPQRPTYDQGWSALNPFRFWLIPKRFAGQNRALYYFLFFLNLVFFLAQFVLLLIPFAIRFTLFIIRYVWRRFLRARVTPALKSLKEKAAVPPVKPAEGESKPSGTKSS